MAAITYTGQANSPRATNAFPLTSNQIQIIGHERTSRDARVTASTPVAKRRRVQVSPLRGPYFADKYQLKNMKRGNKSMMYLATNSRDQEEIYQEFIRVKRSIRSTASSYRRRNIVDADFLLAFELLEVNGLSAIQYTRVDGTAKDFNHTQLSPV